MLPAERFNSRVTSSTAFLAVVAVLAILASAARADNPPAPDSVMQPLRDGCQRDPGALLAGATPEWAYVYNTPADQPAPPPRWVTGVASSQNPAFQAVHTSGADLPSGHDAYDFNLNVLPDPGYTYLLGGAPASSQIPATGNYAGNGEDTGRVHTEWEDLTIPKFAWPEPGDHVTELGNWVWDCGHWGTPTNIFSPDYDLPHEGQPCPSPFAPDPSQCSITGESTEFHPYRAIFVQRQQSPSSPTGENQADLFVSTDKTRAGKTEDCAHKFPPPPSFVLPNPAAYPPQFNACLETEPNWQDVTGDYSFLVPAPSQPTPNAQLTFRAVDQGTLSAPAPTLTQEGNAVRVTFHLDSPPDQRVLFAYTVFVGWNVPPPAGEPTHLHVTFDKLEVHRAMDPGCTLNNPAPGCQFESTRTTQATTAPGEWNLFWDVNGIWGQWPPGEFQPNDGDVIDGTQSVDLYVPPGKGWRLYVHGRECDVGGVDPARPLADCPTDRELADGNDVQGMILDTYPSAAASLGTHRSNARTAQSDPTSTCPDNVNGANPNPEGCYSLTYTVTVPYPRPLGATPLRASLVPAYRQCTSANSQHGPPLSFGSCVPPAQTSGFLTVGTPDSNGAPANAVGSVLYRVSTAGPSDVLIDVSTTDVRCKSAANTVCRQANGVSGPDYTGQLRADQALRITDRQNGPSRTLTATTEDIPFPVTVPCTATPDTAVGSTCAVSTSANAIVPGSVTSGARAIWEMDQVKVFDGGATGVVGSSDATLFETQGVFVP